ncbi:MAG: LCP family protein [Actinobacteria bacterium]|nr:LCP family protein [Actinomycetota bacterium]
MSDPRHVLERPPPPPYRRRGPGSRIARRRAIAKQRRKKALGLVIFLWVLVGAVIAGGILLFQNVREGSSSAVPPGGETVSSQRTWLAIGTVESDPDLGAAWLTVFSEDPEGNQGVVLYIPRTAYVEIPGFGQEIIGKALSLGREPLQLTAVANMLGVQFDHFLKISDQGIQALVDKMGGVTLEVSAPLTVEEAGRVRTIFAEGTQTLNGERAAQYLAFVESNGDEISRAARHAVFWSAFFEKFNQGDGPEGVSALMAGSTDLYTTNGEGSDVAKLMSSLVEMGDRVAFETLPVQSTGLSTGTQFYSVDREAVDRLVKRYLAGSQPAGSGVAGRRLEILNGNGVPGIGQRVGDQLVPNGFRIILNQNARHFDYDVSQIVVYSNSDEALAVANEVKGILGVGEVVISRQRQSLVDLTIVVGKDYIEKHGNS